MCPSSRRPCATRPPSTRATGSASTTSPLRSSPTPPPPPPAFPRRPPRPGGGRAPAPRLAKARPELRDERQHDAQQHAGGDREIEPEAGPLDADVAGELAEERQLRAEPQRASHQREDDAEDHEAAPESLHRRSRSAVARRGGAAAL